MSNFRDIVDELFADLMDIKKMLRGEKIRGSFQNQARKEIDKHLNNIDKDTQVPKN